MCEIDFNFVAWYLDYHMIFCKEPSLDSWWLKLCHVVIHVEFNNIVRFMWYLSCIDVIVIIHTPRVYVVSVEWLGLD